MGEWIALRAADGQELAAYTAWPQGEPVAALVVAQEIFGVNDHIRRVCDGWAKDGFLAVAPALFDRIERGVELGYEGADVKKARSFLPRLNPEKSLMDVAAAVDYAAKSTGKKVGVVGYSYGGTIAWLAAARLQVQAAVGYYGGRIIHYVHQQPSMPVMLHFGRRDQHIPAENVEKVKSAHPGVQVFWYDAGHGFNCDAGASFDPESARVSRERALAFFREHLL